MTRFLIKTLQSTAIATLGTLALTAQAQNTIRWNVGGTIMAGSGCQYGVDAFAQTNGNDLALIFTTLGVNMPGASFNGLAQRSNCSVRVPATIAKGVYIADLVQRLSAGAIKTAGSNGSISTRSTFFNFNVSPATLSLPNGSVRTAASGPLAVSRTDRFAVNTSWWTSWCGPFRNPNGLFSSNMVVQGQRNSTLDDLIINVDSYDVKFEVVAALAFCSVS